MRMRMTAITSPGTKIQKTRNWSTIPIPTRTISQQTAHLGAHLMAHPPTETPHRRRQMLGTATLSPRTSETTSHNTQTSQRFNTRPHRGQRQKTKERTIQNTTTHYTTIVTKRNRTTRQSPRTPKLLETSRTTKKRIVPSITGTA